MAYEIPGQVISLKCGPKALEKYSFVCLAGDGSGLCYSDTQQCVGVLQRDAQPGEVVPVMTSGVSMLHVPAAIPAGEGLTNSTDKYGTRTAAKMGVSGIALEAAKQKGDLVPCLITFSYRNN